MSLGPSIKENKRVQVYPAMVERLARVLESADVTGTSDTWMCYAPAVVQILDELHDPSQAMLDAGCASHPHEPYDGDTKLGDIILAEWRAMLKRAKE